jgi:hypothetical protein
MLARGFCLSFFIGYHCQWNFDKLNVMKQLPYANEIAREVKATPPEYLPALLSIVRTYRQSVTLPSAGQSLRQGLREAVAGETYPLKDLWKDMDGE